MMKRLFRVSALALALSVAAPTAPLHATADPDGDRCASLCGVATQASGYIGLDAFWYFFGCWLGCMNA